MGDRCRTWFYRKTHTQPSPREFVMQRMDFLCSFLFGLRHHYYTYVARFAIHTRIVHMPRNYTNIATVSFELRPIYAIFFTYIIMIMIIIYAAYISIVDFMTRVLARIHNVLHTRVDNVNPTDVQNKCHTANIIFRQNTRATLVLLRFLRVYTHQVPTYSIKAIKYAVAHIEIRIGVLKAIYV